MSLSQDMLTYRAKKRISQTELAKACGVSLQTICSVEREQQYPSRITEAKIRLVIGKSKEEQ